MELAVLGTRQLFFDIRKIAVVHIDIAAVYVKPCATIENPATPCADLGDITLPTDLAEILGIEVTTVIDRQIPITIRTMSSWAREPPNVTASTAGSAARLSATEPRKAESDVVIGLRR